VEATLWLISTTYRGHPSGVLGANMKARKRDSVSISKETKGVLDSIKRPGQSYDGVIQELVNCWKKNQETEGESGR